MIGFLSRYDRLFSKEIAALAILLVANFICALTVSILFANQDPETRSMIQLATIAVISMLSCVVLIQLNSSRVAAVAAMDTLVAKDKLTGLANREVFQHHLAERMEHDRDHPFILMLLDLDRFKELNAFLGYNSADQLLQKICRTVGAAGRDRFGRRAHRRRRICAHRLL